jgi:hypothetical protein
VLSRPGLAGPGKRRSEPRERKKEQGHGWAASERARVRLGRARGGEGVAGPCADFCFSISKMLNSNSFCLFHYKISRAPKILKIFVKPLCTMYYLGKI